MPKKAMFIINDIDFYLKVVEKAKANGKKPGDSMQEEFEEMIAADPGAVTFIGTTDKDTDVMIGDLREQGVKVINPHEIDRQKGKNA